MSAFVIDKVEDLPTSLRFTFDSRYFSLLVEWIQDVKDGDKEIVFVFNSEISGLGKDFIVTPDTQILPVKYNTNERLSFELKIAHRSVLVEKIDDRKVRRYVSYEIDHDQQTLDVFHEESFCTCLIM